MAKRIYMVTVHIGEIENSKSPERAFTIKLYRLGTQVVYYM